MSNRVDSQKVAVPSILGFFRACFHAARCTPDSEVFPGLSMGGEPPFDVASDTCLKPPEIVGPGMLIQVISV